MTIDFKQVKQYAMDNSLKQMDLINNLMDLIFELHKELDEKNDELLKLKNSMK